MSRNDQHYRDGSDANRSGHRYQNHQSVGQHRPNGDHRGRGDRDSFPQHQQHEGSPDSSHHDHPEERQQYSDHDTMGAHRTGNRQAIGGPHAGRGPKGYRRSDERIEEEINEALTHDASVDASEIKVKVVDGEATLTGTVEDRQAKRHAEDLAVGCSGVRDVLNQLRIHATSEKGSAGPGHSR